MPLIWSLQKVSRVCVSVCLSGPAGMLMGPLSCSVGGFDGSWSSAGVAEKTAESTQLKMREAHRQSFVSVEKSFLPSAGKLRALGCSSSLSLGSGDCVRVNTGRSLSLPSKGRLFKLGEGNYTCTGFPPLVNWLHCHDSRWCISANERHEFGASQISNQGVNCKSKLGDGVCESSILALLFCFRGYRTKVASWSGFRVYM